jgi:D-alanyl-D-alanine carboxypeptidase/D-alanyl-D-alanine-endopeptidase (penicillin-binding protein 4)
MMLVLALFAPVLTNNLDVTLNSALLKGSSCSACVTKLDGTVLYDRNSDLRLIPASNQKLFTAAFALHDLGLTYHPSTRFWKQSDRVVVETTGDPMLTFADLTHAKDVLHLTGKLPVYVKEPYRIGYLPQWQYDDLPNKYAAPVTGLTVDRGSYELWEDSTHAYFQPDPYGAKIVRFTSGNRHAKYDPFTRTARVYGDYPDSARIIDTYSVPDPDKAAASILGDGFHEIKEAPTATPDLVLEGPMLPAIIKECLVHSDNNIAENLLLLAAINGGDLGDKPYDTACQRETDFFNKTVGLEAGDIRPDDGSGLSRHNLATTRSIAKLLQWESQQTTFDLWKESLASPGDGTLKDRLKDSTFIGKTGTMEGITALSGYVKTKDGQQLVVSMLFNGHVCPNSKIREIEDEFVRKIEASTLSGTVLEGPPQRESNSAQPSPSLVSLDRLHRSARNGGASR